MATTQKTQNICITFMQRRLNVFDVGPTLYKCFTNSNVLNTLSNFNALNTGREEQLQTLCICLSIGSRPIGKGALVYSLISIVRFKSFHKHQFWTTCSPGHILFIFRGSQAGLPPCAPFWTNPRWPPFITGPCHNLQTNTSRDTFNNTFLLFSTM